MIVHEGANRVVKLQIGGEPCAVRMPRLDDAQLQIDRGSELAAMQAAATIGLTPEIVSFDVPSGVMITRWIDEPVWTPEQARAPRRIELIASTLRRLHGLAPPAGVRRLDLQGELDAYWSALAGQLADLPPQFPELHRAALQLLKIQPATVSRLCHNDLNCRNIIGTGSNLRLLDWEYAGLGDPLFDLAAYTQSNGLDAESARLLLNTYGASSEMLERFPAQCRLFDWVCILWTAVSAPRPDYPQYGPHAAPLSGLQ